MGSHPTFSARAHSLHEPNMRSGEGQDRGTKADLCKGNVERQLCRAGQCGLCYSYCTITDRKSSSLVTTVW